MDHDRHTITTPQTRLPADATAAILQDALRLLSEHNVTTPADRAVRRAEYQAITRTATWIAAAAQALADDLRTHSDDD